MLSRNDVLRLSPLRNLRSPFLVWGRESKWFVEQWRSLTRESESSKGYRATTIWGLQIGSGKCGNRCHRCVGTAGSAQIGKPTGNARPPERTNFLRYVRGTCPRWVRLDRYRMLRTINFLCPLASLRIEHCCFVTLKFDWVLANHFFVLRLSHLLPVLPRATRRPSWSVDRIARLRGSGLFLCDYRVPQRANSIQFDLNNILRVGE